MPKAQVDRALQEKVIRLRDKGDSYDSIAKATGLSKSTVRDIVKRGLSAESPIRTPANKTPARTRDKVKEEIDEGAESDPNPHVESAPESALSALTRERTAKELLSFIAVSKKGYVEAKASKQDPDNKTWQETQYLKLYKDGIKMLIDCTGLSREAIDSLPTSPVDDYLAKALESLKEGQT